MHANAAIAKGSSADLADKFGQLKQYRGCGGVDSTIIVHGTDAAGQPSHWQSVGVTNLGESGGPASLSILAGGQVSSFGAVSVGANIMADGSALEIRGTTTAGDPSSLTSNAFQLGLVGASGGLSRATVQVAAGGHLSTGDAEVRRDSLIIIEGEAANLNPSQWHAGSVNVSGGFVEVVNGGYVSSDFVNLNRLAITRVNGIGTDFNLWMSNRGFSAAGATVPEPTGTLRLIPFAFAAFACKRKGRSSNRRP
ncbi:MAG: hypothetical protein KDA60_04525 [Planctomycetales bacterium]|nr:hypothetical protein [Planctomycetales bacterium]